MVLIRPISAAKCGSALGKRANRRGTAATANSRRLARHLSWRDSAGGIVRGWRLLCRRTVIGPPRSEPRVSPQRQTILIPRADFDCNGFVPNGTFPTGVIAQDRSLLVYYGAGDTVFTVVQLSLDDVLASLRE